MKALSTADRMHTQATDCWISVGDVDRATAELEQIPPASRDHPDVLQVRWHLCAQAHEWDVCLEIATTLTQTTPERPFGWVTPGVKPSPPREIPSNYSSSERRHKAI